MRLFAADQIPGLKVAPQELPAPWVLPWTLPRGHRDRLAGLLIQALQRFDARLHCIQLRFIERGLLEKGRLSLPRDPLIWWLIGPEVSESPMDILKECPRLINSLCVYDFAGEADVPGFGWLGPFKVRVLHRLIDMLLDQRPVPQAEGMAETLQDISQVLLSPIDLIDCGETLLEVLAAGGDLTKARAEAVARVIAGRFAPGLGDDARADAYLLALVAVREKQALGEEASGILYRAGFFEKGMQMPLPILDSLQDTETMRRALHRIAGMRGVSRPAEELAPAWFERAPGGIEKQGLQRELIRSGTRPTLSAAEPSAEPLMHRAVGLLKNDEPQKAADLLIRALREGQVGTWSAADRRAAALVLFEAAQELDKLRGKRPAKPELERIAVIAEASADLFERVDDWRGVASSYHQLGRIAQEQRDLAAAEQWYRRALAIFEKQGDEHRAAISYHSLGVIGQEHRDFEAAEQWYRKALAIFEKQGDEHRVAVSYHQLGMLAQEHRDLAAAEQWYRKSLAIEEKQGNEHGAAGSYHQLGMLAEEKRDFDAAEQWYRKSLAIFEKQGDELGAANSYHQLGMLAQEQKDLAAAEQWYAKSLAIEEKQGNEYGMASSYHQLGRIAQEHRNLAAAEQWYRKSLAIFEKQGDKHGLASSYGQLGILAALQGHFEESGWWLIRSILAFANARDPHNANRNARNFLINYNQALPPEQEKLRALWTEAGLGPFPDPSV